MNATGVVDRVFRLRASLVVFAGGVLFSVGVILPLVADPGSGGTKRDLPRGVTNAVQRGTNPIDPFQINHQGVVEVNNVRFNGTGLFRFALVDTNNIIVWTNDGTQPLEPTTDVSLSVVDGVYSVRLGDTAPPTNMNAIPSSIFGPEALKLRIWFNDGTHGSQPLSPDQPLTAVPYAFSAAPGAGAMPGEIRMWAGPESTIPAGWLPCDGRELSRMTYSTLHTAIQDSWGFGNGTTTFNIPDLRGRFPRGVNQTVVRGSQAAGQGDPDASARSASNPGGNPGSNVGSLQLGATAPPTTDFNFTVSGGSHSHTLPAYTGGCCSSNQILQGAIGPTGANVSTNGSGSHSHSIIANNSNPGGDAETRPVNVYVFYIIKY